VPPPPLASPPEIDSVSCDCAEIENKRTDYKYNVGFINEM